MSVYTAITSNQVESVLTQFKLGSLVEFEGILAGIENSNYTIITTQGTYILTIFESLTATELPFYLNLLNHLKQQNFPAPLAQTNKKNEHFFLFKEKPAAFFNRLPGSSICSPSIIQCQEIGQYLAKLHQSCKRFKYNKKNVKNLTGCQAIFKKIYSKLKNDELQLIRSELNHQLSYSLPDLEYGIIHADLFKDNVLFDNGHISGILDFYNACNDYFLYDIAITCNDWCVENGHFNKQKMLGLLSGYNAINSLSSDELEHFPIFLRLSALRFWLSRLDHQYNPRAGELTLTKTPLEFRRLLEHHRLDR